MERVEFPPAVPDEDEDEPPEEPDEPDELPEEPEPVDFDELEVAFACAADCPALYPDV